MRLKSLPTYPWRLWGSLTLWVTVNKTLSIHPAKGSFHSKCTTKNKTCTEQLQAKVSCMEQSNNVTKCIDEIISSWQDRVVFHTMYLRNLTNALRDYRKTHNPDTKVELDLIGIKEISEA